MWTRLNFIYNGKTAEVLMSVKEIPITYGGMIECNIENSLAAASALYGLNLSIEAIRKDWQPLIPIWNPTREGLYRGYGRFKVMLDYGTIRQDTLRL